MKTSPSLRVGYNLVLHSVAGVAELVDAADSKSAASDSVRVRVPPSAPTNKKASSGRFFICWVKFESNQSLSRSPRDERGHFGAQST